jgi:hypothetical protein
VGIFLPHKFKKDGFEYRKKGSFRVEEAQN